MRTIVTLQLCILVVVLAGCERHPAKKPAPPSSAATAAKIDICALLTNPEIEALQGSPVKEAKPSESAGSLQTSQCFYVASEFSKSVNTSLTRAAPGSSDKNALREFWEKTFSKPEEQKAEHEREREGDREKRESLRQQRREKEEEEHEAAPLQKIEGVGEEAYWSGTRVGGALYVLKNDVFIRISLGGADTNEARIEKAKKLAAKMLERL